jgi:2-polyprenyl-3-methyl-5-hydroxy-6-metoxy-1,4-benzoquinol methylase
LKKDNVKQWYELLFQNYARIYDNETFTQGTLQEVDFIEAELNNDRTKRILDIDCSTGRHSIELVKRGYKITGIDYSESQLRRARAKALEAQILVEFIQADARALKFSHVFDVAIMVCEGGFPLMETDEMNFAILQGAARALKSEGTFILTSLNALFPLTHSIEEFMKSNTIEGTSSGHTIDPMTLRDSSTFEVIDDDGLKMTLHSNERYYMPSEIT